jgi:hypothetical protein
LDLNQRSVSTIDLQSIAINRSTNHPFYFLYESLIDPYGS